MDEVLLGKAAIIERCLRRINEEYRGHEAEFATNFTKQDAILLNLLRACEASIDAAMHLVRRHRLGIPTESRQLLRCSRRLPCWIRNFAGISKAWSVFAISPYIITANLILKSYGTS